MKIILGLISLMISMSAHAVVLDDDNRKFVESNGYIHNRTLYITIGCTASLIGKDLVLTAAHCLKPYMTKIEGEWQLKKKSSMILLAGYELSTRKFITTTKVLSAEWGSFDFEKENHDDWAILRIDKELGEELGYYELMEDRSKMLSYRLTLVGYSGDRVDLSYAQECAALPYLIEHFPLFHSCDGTPGTSGGPLLLCNEDRTNCVVLGVASGENETFTMNSAVHLSRFIGQAKKMKGEGEQQAD